MPSTKTRALDAAVELLAAGGLRALTHARVDDAAGVPKGSTSNYFRTRAALLAGVSAWIVERELPSVREAFLPRNPEELIDAMCALLELTTGPNRVQTTARLVLFMEASHNAELRAPLAQGRAALEAAMVSALAGIGARDPRASALTIAACFEGLILHRIARGDTSDPRPIFETVVHGAFTGASH